MTLQTLLATLAASGIQLRGVGEEIVVTGNEKALDAELVSELRAHKATLRDFVREHGGWWAPPLITPEMLPLVTLTQAEIDGIVAGVEGGAGNVQDIYPLVPLQEGILFHHLLSEEGDPYLLSSVTEFDTRARLERYLAALQAVIDRHDVLRTAVAWEGLREPVQVVWRYAPLPVEEVELTAGAEDAAEQLWRRHDPRHYRMDLGRAPLRRACIAEDRARGRWLLLMLTHHLTSDHESLEVEREEISAHLRGLEAELPAPLAFRNYVARVSLGVSREEHERFFRGLLGDVEEPTAPYGLLDVWGEGRGIREAWLPVAGDVAARLRRRARALGVSAASLWHLAWAQVLARLSGRQDVVFGTLLFGRMQGGEGADRVMGPFINTLPVRIRVGEEGVEAAVRRTHALLADLLRHEHASLALAQRCSGVAAPAPLFTSLLNYRYSGARGRTQAQQAGQPGEGVRCIFGQERNNYPVTLNVDDLGEEFSLLAQVAAPAEAERVCVMMHTALERLVEALELSPGRAMGSIDVLPEAERRLVVEEWNRTEAEYSADRCIHELFEVQAARTPGAVAVRFEEESLAYAELNERANRLAHYLVRLGVGPEVRVGLCLERSLEMVVAILAVLKAGGAYVPLDPAYPAERLGFILADSATPVLLTQETLRGALPALEGVEVVSLDGGADEIAAGSAENPESGAGPDSLAYVIYTSGSTGAPKGALIEHRNVARLFAATQAGFGFGESDVWTLFHSYAFDFSVWELWGALLYGGRLVVVPRSVTRDPAAFRKLLARERVTVLSQTPSAFRALAKVDEGEFEPLQALRTVVFGGEALQYESLRGWLDRYGPKRPRLVNMYGITETTVHVTWHTVTGRELKDADAGSLVGKAIPDLRAYVLDPAGNPSPVGVPGELHVGGAGLARGYLGRPGLTAQRFVPDPFSGEAGARLYRSGDLARWKASGELEYLGRIDQQVKIRGFRIELGEIESVLLAHPGVASAAVIVRGEGSDAELVAYLVAAGTAPSPAELRDALKRHLPEYMVPAAFVAIDRIPLTANGKLDRRALPAPEAAAAGAEDGYVAPRTPVEEVLAAIWCGVLRRDRVGAGDDFFAVGGHSLRATQVATRIRDTLGVELPLRALFEAPTLAELAARVEEMRRAGLPVLPPVVPVERTGALPLSFAQERLWFLDRLEPGSATYNMPTARRLGGALDEAALERALGEIVRRHEALRTVFAEVDGSPVQVITPFDGFALPVEDLSGLGEADREEAVGGRFGEVAWQPFDLSAGPLFRAALLRLGEEDHVLLLSMHHIVSDGWSMGVLFRELWALYEAYLAGRESPLPELPVQYADYAVWQRARLRGEELDRQLAWWRERLAGAPALLELPTDRPRPAVQGHRGAVRSLRIDAATADELRALCRDEGVTIFMTLLAGFAVLLGRYSGQADVVVGAPVATRGQRETEGLIGFFLNTLALRTDLSGDPSFRELLGQVRETTLGAYVHQDIPFERILEELQPARTLSHSPLFQVMLNLQNLDGGAPLDLAEGRAERFGGGLPVVKYDLTLYASERDGEIQLSLAYNADLFEDARMEDALGHLRSLFAAVAADPELRVSRIPLLTAEERRARLVRAQGIGTDRPFEEFARVDIEQTISARFAAQVRLHPDRLAVRTRTTRLTYAELSRAAEAVARAILRIRPAAAERVALLFEHDAAMIIGILGVLRAGKTYVPIDPLYPRERNAYVLEDSGADALLTNRANLALARELARERVPVVDLDAVDTTDDAPVAFPQVRPDEAAYILYTSGSTGRPKGVVQSHRNVLHFIRVYTNNLRIGPEDRLTLFSSYTFDASVMAVYGALLNGAAIFPLGWREESASGVAEWMRREGITLYHSTPTVFRHLVEGLGGEERFPEVRLVVLGGEETQRRDVDAFRAHFAPGAILVNGLGPTESTVTLQNFIGHDTPVQRNTVPVGYPVEDTEVVLRNGLGEQVAVYGVGEIEIHSAHVALGYWRRPEQTAAAFGDAPGAGARSYRTGDLGRRLPDGSLEFVGRADFQVKIRGVRVELGEIEAAMRAHPAVREAVVAAREEGGAGGRWLAGYVVAAEDAEVPAPEEMRAWLRERLPEPMVPAVFVGLEALPLTPGGKVDRLALPAPERAEAAGGFAPRTPVEEVLAGIWAEILRLERVGVEQSFFELGGHSLLATRVVSRVRELFGVELPLRALFEGPTVAELAVRVDALRQGGARALPPVVPVDRDRPLPLSFAQERLWFLDRLEGGGSAAYNLPAALRLAGALDAAAVERSLGEIVRRHETLRTVIRELDGGAVQVIAPFAGFALPVDDLSGLDERARETEVRRRAREDAARPFDLAEGPLFRAALLRVADEEHVLLLCIHHIVSDGWSSGVLHRELGALYAAFSRGEGDPLPPLPVQYADYAVWQREQLAGEALDRQLAYWKERLAGAPALLELPTDRPRPPVQSHRGARERFDLPRALLDRLQALGRSEGATLYMVMLSAFQLLLSRYSGSEDVVVGSPIAGRTRREVEELIGFFANTLVLRTDLGGDPTFRELLGRVREGTLGAYEHQEVPFERLVAELQPVRSLSHSPLFQVMFTLQNADRSGSGLAGLRMAGMGGESETTRFDLALTAVPHDDGVYGALEYGTDLFDRSTVRRMLAHLERVLEQVAADADVRLSQLELLSAEERRMVVEAWNATDAAFSAGACVHELFEAQVERTPGATALVFEDETLSYAELNARANRLAHRLRALGVGPDARVGICVERSLEMVVGLLGVLKAGGAYVPLDPSYPAERLRYVLHDSAPAAVLTQRSLEGVEALFADVEAPVIDLGGAEWAWCPETDPGRAGLTPGHLAYVIYTSGSTGRPKGVAVPHRGVVNLLGSMREIVGMEPADRLLAVTTYAFDISVLEIFLPLLHGAATIVLPRERAADPPALAEAIRTYGPTVMQATPATWRMLVSAEWKGAPEMRALCGGEALPAELASAVRSRVGALWNVYGPTETTIWSTAEPVRGDPVGAAGANVPIGRPVANTRVYVLDAALQPVPVGVAGELWIGGAGVVRGYLGRPEQTAERFVADAYGGEPGARLYRTGDLARWRPDGTIEFLGRTDFQVKVRGFRIELGEIEARLGEHPGVRVAVVMAREDVPGDQRLVAYVVGDADAESLRAHLSTALPEYMVPAAYVRLEALPLTPNGKLDRKALPAPEGDAYTSREYEAPVGKIEVALAEIWMELLGVERVGRRDHFFELGGHSLLAVQVISRVRQVLGLEVALGEMFTRPVLADFARGLATAARSELPPIEPAPREGRVPLSFAQQRLFFLEQLGDLRSTYHLSQRLPLRGELDRAALVRALDRIVARHEALRTTFTQVDGVPEQRIEPADIGFRLEEHHLSGEADAQAKLGRLLAEEAGAPFDLERGPLIRGRLIRVSPDDHVLAVTMHHIVSDAWSVELFTRELGALYGAFRRGEPDPLPALPVQYADYAAWQRRWVEGDVLQAQTEYWTETLAGAPELLELPTDHPRPARQDHAGAAMGVVMDEALTAGLKALGQRHGTTLFMTVLAGWAAVLGRLSGQRDVVVGTPTANRGRIEIEGLIGFFVNTLPLRVDLAGSPSVAEVLTRVKERSLGAQQNQDIPFEQVVELVQPVRSMAHSPLFQVVFGWQNAPRGGLELPGLTLGSLGSPGSPGSAGSAGSAGWAGWAGWAGSAGSASGAAAKFDLSLDLSERGGRIVGGVTYATSLFDRATVERHVGYLRRVLEAMVADERQPVDRLALLPEHERRQVVEEWNATDAEYPANACVHELFQAQAERTPGAVAVVFEDQRSSYAELNARANRLAHHLRSLGVGPDARVAVCVERSAEMVVALLAVMKAGGAYVPLDPGHPAERLEYMLADSAPAAVLTQKHFRDRTENTGVPVLEIDTDRPEWMDQPATDPAIEGLTPAHLVYVIYTSGSTGRPKGVAVPHRGVVNLLRSMREIVGMEPADRLLAVTTYAFDISVLEIFLPLLHGAGTIILPRERAGDPAALAEAIRTYGPTVMQATPATWRMLVSAEWAGAPEMRALCGGEALPAELASAVRSRVGALWNVYGPTETTIWSTAEAVHGDPASAVVPVGRPVANTRVYVLDAALQPVPVGVAGELYIGGAGVVRGYLGRAGQTAERFVADAYGGEPGARLYRTGDLARWRPDGTIEFVGRTDFQVKVRGFRIELGEIEARLAEHPGVRVAVVMAREDVPGDVRLVAYVVGDADAESLRAHLSTALPEYMVPAAYVRLEALPLTPNGKLDRKALPAPEGDAYASREYEAPVGKIEVALAEIWTELLRVERVGRRDHFFELGGHSLLALQVVSRVRKVMQVELALAAVFEKPVFAALADRIVELRLARFNPETVARLAQLVREPGAETA